MDRPPSAKRPAKASPEITRRAVLQYLGAGAALSFASTSLEGCGAAPDGLGESTSTSTGSLEWSSPTEIIRPDDLLVMKVSFANLVPSGGRLTRSVNAQPAYLRMDLPPQAMIEDAYTPAEAFPKLVGSQLSAKSRIVVRVPAAFRTAPLTVATLIDLLTKGDLVVAPSARNLRAPAPVAGGLTLAGWSGFNAALLDRFLAGEESASASRHRKRVATVVARSTGTPVSPPGEPAAPPDDGTFTAIEMPHRLRLSPGPTAAWGAAAAPVVSPINGRVEVWSTYLGGRDPETKAVTESADALLIGAIAARSVGAEAAHKPVRFPTLSNDQRARLVTLTTGSAGRAAQAKRVSLSALGGNLDIRGEFADTTIKSWTHKLSGGREQFVEVVEVGWLLPFGHRATVLKIAQRSEDPSKEVGSLRRFDVLIIKKPVVTFGACTGTPAETAQLRGSCFSAVTLADTEVILEPSADNRVTWIRRLGSTSPSRFAFTGHDQCGRPHPLDTRLYFVNGNDSVSGAGAAGEARLRVSAADGALNLAAALAEFKSETFAVKGQRVAYAPSRTDDTSFETHALKMDLKAAPGRPFAALPVLDTVDIVVDAVERLGGVKRAVYKIADTYKTSGFEGANKTAKTLLATTAAMAPIDVGAVTDGAAGLVNPKVAFDTISKTAGPAMSTALSAAGTFDPKMALAGAADLKLFGVFALTEVLETVGKNVLGGDPLRFAPRFVTDALHEAERVIATVANVVHTVIMLREHALELVEKADKAVRDAPAEAERRLRDAKAKVEAVVTAAETVYETGTAIVACVENGDIEPLALPVDGKPALLPKLKADIGEPQGPNGQPGTGLRGALFALAELAQVEQQLAVIDGVGEEVEKALDAATSFLTDVTKVMKILSGAQKGLEAARDLAVKVEWRPKIKSFGSVFFPSSKYGLLLAIEIRAKAQNGKPAGTDLMCRLDAFSLRFGLDTSTEEKSELTAKFKRFVLKRDAGKKPDVDIIFDGLHFGGKLKFIETLRNLIPLDGFSDPPYLDITASGIVAGFSIAIPAVAVGMFSIENITLGAELTIPFVGDAPVFSFNFSEKDNPFLVTYAMLGGGGYFRIELTPLGFKRLELSLCVGAQLALNFGVASGSVSIFAGITMSYDVQEGVMLTAFVRVHGHLEVLGLISISVDLTISLTYDGCELKGVAELRVDVEVLFFSKTVYVRFERTFVGANADPTLRDVMLPYCVDDPFAERPALCEGAVNVFPFIEYCEAFA